MNKKLTLFAAALALSMGGSFTAQAQDMSPTATANVYDFSGWNDVTLINLFYNAQQAGRNYPTIEEFEAAGIQKSDIAFIRSHVRNQNILSRADRAVSDTYEKRNLWMNIPMDAGKQGHVGQPSNTFHSDVYSMWNYTKLFGSWNHGFFTAPGAWVDAAHKNGTEIFSGIKFFDTTGGRPDSDSTWQGIISQKNSDGSFKYSEAIINCCMYFGSDGINYNWEDSGYSNSNVVAFHKDLYKKAAEKGYDTFHVGLYTSASYLQSSNVNALFGNSEGRTADTFLNYAGDNFQSGARIQASVQAAETAMGTSEGVYQGTWIVTMNRSWSNLNYSETAKRMGVVLWGEHDQSRFWSYNSGGDTYEAQRNYQWLLERGFSGGNRNPISRPSVANSGHNWEWSGTTPPLSTFHGIASFIPERSAIQGNLPFVTHFNLGNGDRYNYKGKKTTASYYNMASQDIVPTFRWLVVDPGTMTASTKISADLSHDDSYMGGSSLKLTGEAISAGTDLILYKTNLVASAGGTYVKVAVKTGKEGSNASSLYVILKKNDGTWVEVPVGNVDGAQWIEKKIDVADIAAGTTIERIGLRVKGNDSNYKIYVGKLELNDNVKTTVAAVGNVNVEVKEETKTSMTAKVFWDVDKTGITATPTRDNWDMLYNDEANIHHFEVLYKNGEQGTVSEIMRTTQWSALAYLNFELVGDQPFIGVRSVSTDLKTYSPVTWVEVSRAEQNALPEAAFDDPYGVSAMDPNCNGADVARRVRFVTDFTTTGAKSNLNYHATGPVADGSQYVYYKDEVLKVEQGQEVTFFLKCYNPTDAKDNSHDGLRYCFAGGWLDLDGSKSFNPEKIEDNPAAGEQIFFVGTIRAATMALETPGVTFKVTIPSDARTGQSRLRLVFSDAWFAGSFVPTGLHTKGFSMDFDVEISGNNAQRQGPADIHDQGVAEQPEDLDGTNGVINVNGNVSEAIVSDGVLSFANVDKAWVYTTDGQMVKFVKNAQNAQVSGLANGVYLVKMQNGNILRSSKIVIK